MKRPGSWEWFPEALEQLAVAPDEAPSRQAGRVETYGESIEALNRMPVVENGETLVDLRSVQPPLAFAQAHPWGAFYRRQFWVRRSVAGMLARGRAHDASKLEEPEKAMFDEAIPLLADLAYGSPEYEALVERLRPGLEHHYRCNSHHPEHYGETGVAGMDLFDIVEMVCDWMAAAERKPDDGVKLAYNVRLFGIEPQLANLQHLHQHVGERHRHHQPHFVAPVRHVCVVAVVAK